MDPAAPRDGDDRLAAVGRALAQSLLAGREVPVPERHAPRTLVVDPPEVPQDEPAGLGDLDHGALDPDEPELRTESYIPPPADVVPGSERMEPPRRRRRSVFEPEPAQWSGPDATLDTVQTVQTVQAFETVETFETVGFGGAAIDVDASAVIDTNDVIEAFETADPITAIPADGPDWSDWEPVDRIGPDDEDLTPPAWAQLDSDPDPVADPDHAPEPHDERWARWTDAADTAAGTLTDDAHDIVEPDAGTVDWAAWGAADDSDDVDDDSDDPAAPEVLREPGADDLEGVAPADAVPVTWGDDTVAVPGVDAPQVARVRPPAADALGTPDDGVPPAWADPAFRDGGAPAWTEPAWTEPAWDATPAFDAAPAWHGTAPGGLTEPRWPDGPAWTDAPGDPAPTEDFDPHAHELFESLPWAKEDPDEPEGRSRRRRRKAGPETSPSSTAPATTSDGGSEAAPTTASAFLPAPAALGPAADHGSLPALATLPPLAALAPAPAPAPAFRDADAPVTRTTTATEAGPIAPPRADDRPAPAPEHRAGATTGLTPATAAGWLAAHPILERPDESTVRLVGRTDEDEETTPTARRTVVEWGMVLGSAVIVALLVKFFVIQSFSIPSESMYPTLKIDDRVVVNQLAYDVGSDVERFDVIVFRHVEGPGPARPDDPEFLIKRVIGLPGDTVEARGGIVYVNGKPLDESAHLGPEVVTNNITQPIEIPQGHYWVMGDNRERSGDSRIFGPVPKDHIVGRAMAVWWPFDRAGSL